MLGMASLYGMEPIGQVVAASMRYDTSNPGVKTSQMLPLTGPY